MITTASPNDDTIARAIASDPRAIASYDEYVALAASMATRTEHLDYYETSELVRYHYEDDSSLTCLLRYPPS